MRAWFFDFRAALAAVVSVGLLGVSASVLASSPIGTLQIDQRVDVTPAGQDSSVRVSDSDYAFHSNDHVATRGGAAVVVLNDGGAIGLGPGSAGRVAVDDDGAVSVVLEDGVLMYSVPADGSRLAITAGTFRIDTDSDQPRAVQVDAGDGRAENERSGMVQLREDGHVRVAVRDGQAQVTRGGDSRFLLAAGEQRGFFNTEALAVAAGQTFAEAIEILVEIEAPEQVGTREDFSVRWDTGEQVRDVDYISIAPVGAEDDEFESVSSTSEGEVLEFEAPGSPGDYEIRYIDGETGEVKSFVYLEVVRDRAVAWWTSREVIGAMAFMGGSTALIIGIGDDDDDDEPPVSP